MDSPHMTSDLYDEAIKNQDLPIDDNIDEKPLTMTKPISIDTTLTSLAHSLMEMGYDQEVSSINDILKDDSCCSLVKAIYRDLCDALQYINDQNDDNSIDWHNKDKNMKLLDNLRQENQKLEFDLREKENQIKDMIRIQEKDTKNHSDVIQDYEFLKENLIKKIERLENDLNIKNNFINEIIGQADSENHRDISYYRKNSHSKTIPDRIMLRTRQVMDMTSNIDFQTKSNDHNNDETNKDIVNKCDSILQESLESRIVDLNNHNDELEKVLSSKEQEINRLKSYIDSLEQDKNICQATSSNIIKENDELNLKEEKHHHIEQNHLLNETIKKLQNQNDYLMTELEKLNQTNLQNNLQSDIYTDQSIPANNNESSNNNKDDECVQNTNYGQLMAQKRLMKKEIDILKSKNQSLEKIVKDLESKSKKHESLDKKNSNSKSNNIITWDEKKYHDCLSLITELRESLISKSRYASDVEDKYMNLLSEFEDFKKKTIAGLTKAVQTESNMSHYVDKQFQCDMMEKVVSKEQSINVNNMISNSELELCTSCMAYLKDLEILKNDNFLLDSQNEAYSSQIEQLKIQLKNLQIKFDQISNELSLFENEKEKKDKLIENLNNSIKDDENKIKNLNRNIKYLENEYEELLMKNSHLYSRCSALETENNNLIIEMNSKVSIIAQFQLDDALLKKNIENIEKDKSELLTENNDIKTKIFDLSNEITSHKLMIAEHLKSLEEKTSELEKCSKDLSNALQSLEEMKDKFEDCQKQLNFEKNRFEQSINHQKKLIEESNNVKLKLEDLNQNNEILKNQKIELEKQLALIQEKASEKTTELLRFKQQIVEMRNIIRCNAETIIKWKNQCENMKNGHIDPDSKNIELLEIKCQNSIKRIEDLECERCELMAKLEDQNRKICQLNADLDHRKNMIDGLKRLLNQKTLPIAN